MGFNCLEATEPLRGGTLLFTTKLTSIISFPKNVMFSAIWYHLYNLKNVKNTHGGVPLLVKLLAFSLQLY